MTKPHTYLTLSQAAEITGKSKSVISKALKTGTMGFVTKNEHGYQIDPAELFRVFPKNTVNTTKNVQKERSRTSENEAKNALEMTLKQSLLEVKLANAEKERELYKSQLGKVEADRDEWRKQAQTLLLTYQPRIKSPHMPHQEEKHVNGSLPSHTSKLTLSDIVWGCIAVFIVSAILWLVSPPR